jgi:hypothetical protein
MGGGAVVFYPDEAASAAILFSEREPFSLCRSRPHSRRADPAPKVTVMVRKWREKATQIAAMRRNPDIPFALAT